MRGQDNHGKDRDGDGIPVEQADVTPDVEVGEEGHAEVSTRFDRNAAGNVPRRRAEKNGQEKTRDDQDEIPELLPESISDMAAHFER